MAWLRALWWLVPGLLLAAAYEVALALGASGVGAVPGSGAPGEDEVAGAAFITMLIGAVLAPLSGVWNAPRWALASIAPAAAAFVVARFYTYDPYFAPSLRRYSDGGAVSVGWIFVVFVAAVAVGILALRLPRIASL